MARNSDWYIHQRLFYQSLGFNSSKIPMDVEKVFVDFAVPIGIRYEECHDEWNRRFYKYHPERTVTATVIVKAKPVQISDRTGRRVHRVFIICPNCKREVPFSRMQQHYGKKTCQSK